ncbi:MAG TPA: site-2 protease family protein [Desulfomonilaceae bacterium]|nr:site-2 protease family protein [Desulfomonilaceae bacterium]
MKWSFKIGSIMGIPIKVHATFLLLLLLIFFAGSSVIGMGGLNGVIFVILVFASVVFHELSHSIVARHFGIGVQDITLLPIGGVSRMANPPDKPTTEVLVAIAGPASSLLLFFLIWFAASMIGRGFSLSDALSGGNLVAQLALVNVVLAVFNLLPAFPMDGGRVLRGLLGLYLSPYKATRIAVGVGQGFAIGLFFLGLYLMNFFMILIALFVYLGAEAEERQATIVSSLGGATAGTAMISVVETLAPGETVGHAAELYCRSFQQDFPVMEATRLVGLVPRELITETLHRRGPGVPVQEIMVTDFPVVAEQTPLMDVFQKFQATGLKVIPVMRGTELRGLITLEQIGRYHMLCSGYSCDFLQPTKPERAAG